MSWVAAKHIIKKSEAVHVREYRLEKKISGQLQVSPATSTSEATGATSSTFSTKQILSRSVHKTEISLPSSKRKKDEVIGTLTKNSIYV